MQFLIILFVYSFSFLVKYNSVLLQVWEVVKMKQNIKKRSYHVAMLRVCPLNLWCWPLWEGCSIALMEGLLYLLRGTIPHMRSSNRIPHMLQTFVNACVWVYAQLCIFVSSVKVFLIYSGLRVFSHIHQSSYSLYKIGLYYD